jgi:Flp pilus assembly protein TadG
MVKRCRKLFGDLPVRLGGRTTFGMNCLSRALEDEGATLVEFALASAIFLTMLFGIIQTALAVYSYNFVSEAARDAARYAIVRGNQCSVIAGTDFNCKADNAAIQAYVQSLVYPGLNGNNLSTTTHWYTAAAAPPNMTWSYCSSDTPAACASPGAAVKVTVSYPFELNVPFLSPMTINMADSSQMVISQ